MRRGFFRPAYLLVVLMLAIRVPACEYQDGGAGQQTLSLISISPSPASGAGLTHA
jgi:hypothetical protein